MPLIFERGTRAEPWTVVQPAVKLSLRGRLPGAFTYDRAELAIRSARRAGVTRGDLLAVAMPCSWLVNNPAPSTLFHKWLTPPLLGTWRTLLGELARGSQAMADLDAAAAARLSAQITTLSTDGQGAGAISKVLALLLPDVVPLMPDAAIALALETMDAPSAPDAQTAGADVFVPMLRWFARTVLASHGELVKIATEDERARKLTAPLDPAQVLDRLVWFDSIGYRVFRGKMIGGGGFHWVTAGGTQGIVHVEAPRQGAPDGRRIDLDAEPVGPWRDEALAALHKG